MANDSKVGYFRIGLTAFAGLVAVVFSLVYFGGLGGGSEELLAETYSDRPVSGLSVGSDVNFRGVKIGEVREISFIGTKYDVSGADNQKIYVLMAMKRKYLGLDPDEDPERLLKSLVDRGLRATVTSGGITGLSRIELNLPPEDMAIEPPAPVAWSSEHLLVPPLPSLLENFSLSATRLMNQLNRTDFAGVFSNVASIVRQSESVVSNVQVMTSGLNGIIEEERGTVAVALENLALAAVEARGALVAATGFVARADALLAAGRPGIEALLTNCAVVAESANGTIAEVAELARSARATLGENAADVRGAMEDLRDAAASVRGFAAQLNEDPSVLVRGREVERLPELED